MFFDYKISYRKLWDENGTCFNQIITMKFYNKEVFEFVNRFTQDYVQKHGDFYKKRYFKPLQIGDNFVSLSYRDFILLSYLPEDKRILDRNTVFRIKIYS